MPSDNSSSDTPNLDFVIGFADRIVVALDKVSADHKTGSKAAATPTTQAINSTPSKLLEQARTHEQRAAERSRMINSAEQSALVQAQQATVEWVMGKRAEAMLRPFLKELAAIKRPDNQFLEDIKARLVEALESQKVWALKDTSNYGHGPDGRFDPKPPWQPRYATDAHSAPLQAGILVELREVLAPSLPIAFDTDSRKEIRLKLGVGKPTVVDTLKGLARPSGQSRSDIVRAAITPLPNVQADALKDVVQDAYMRIREIRRQVEVEGPARVERFAAAELALVEGPDRDFIDRERGLAVDLTTAASVVRDIWKDELLAAGYLTPQENWRLDHRIDNFSSLAAKEYQGLETAVDAPTNTFT